MYVKAWAESAAGAWRRPLNGATLEPRRVTPTVHAVVCATVPCDCVCIRREGGEEGDQDRSRGGDTSSQSKKNVAHHVLSTVTLWRNPVLGRHPPRGKVKQWRGPWCPGGQALFKRLRGMGFAVGGLCGTWSASQGFRQRVKHVNHVSGGDELLYVK